MKFPILLKTGAAERPESKLYYEVAANGVFQVRVLPTHRSVTRVTTAVPGLLTQDEGIELNFPRLPSQLLEEVLAFFADVYRHYGGEAIVVLFYRADTQEFRVGVPPQRISGYRDSQGRYWPDRHLEYDSCPRPAGFLRLGTIHSHADMTAYASHTDCQDERYEDGLHAVFGGFHRATLSRSADFVAGGRRFRLEPEDVMEPCEVPDRGGRPKWMGRVTHVEDRFTPTIVTTGGTHGH